MVVENAGDVVAAGRREVEEGGAVGSLLGVEVLLLDLGEVEAVVGATLDVEEADLGDAVAQGPRLHLLFLPLLLLFLVLNILLNFLLLLFHFFFTNVK